MFKRHFMSIYGLLLLNTGHDFAFNFSSFNDAFLSLYSVED